jgi:hypothetical protein
LLTSFTHWTRSTLESAARHLVDSVLGRIPYVGQD